MNQPPSVVSGTPAAATATPQTFAFTGRDPNGYADIARMYFLVNPSACDLAEHLPRFYDRAGNGIYLYNDALTALQGPLTPGTSGTLQNGQCVIYGSTSSLVSAATDRRSIWAGHAGRLTTAEKVSVGAGQRGPGHRIGYRRGPGTGGTPPSWSRVPRLAPSLPPQRSLSRGGTNGYADIFRMSS